jgi:hypothetical protein
MWPERGAVICGNSAHSIIVLEIRAGAVTKCQRKKIAKLSSDQLGRHAT